MVTSLQERPTLLSVDGDANRLSEGAKALVFADPLSRRLLDYIRKLAPSEVPVLIVGETGTGKELVAQHIHRLSGRTGPFLAVNCGAISEQLVESELFGHESGSFTGAVGRREGWFEAANGGTLFLDEIGDLPLAMQVKLLRVLQEREVVRIGSRRPIAIDVRVVAATSLNLEHAVAAGRFRRDLYFRLNTAQAKLPPLRERTGDVLPLAQHFVQGYCRRKGLPVPAVSSAAVEVLRAHAWPGNIRELENAIHFALLMSDGQEILPEHLNVLGQWGVTSPTAADRSSEHGGPAAVAHRLASPLDAIGVQLREWFKDPGDSLYDDLERLVVTEAYRHCDNNQVQSAAMLGISRNVLRTLLKRHRLLRLTSAGHCTLRVLDGAAMAQTGALNATTAATARQLFPGVRLRRMERSRLAGLASVISPLLVLLAWAWVAHLHWFSEQLVVPPAAVAGAFRELWDSGELPADLKISLYRLFAGFGLGAVAGVLLGVLLATSRRAQAYVGPTFELFRQVPTLALTPMFILLFGIGETLKIVIILKSTVYPIATATREAVRNIPLQYIEVGRAYGLRPWARFRRIIFPSTVPAVLTGIRIALGRSWMVLVAVELLAADTGIGQMMEIGRQMLRLDIVMVGVVVTGVIGYALDRGLRQVERALVPWHRQ